MCKVRCSVRFKTIVLSKQMHIKLYLLHTVTRFKIVYTYVMTCSWFHVNFFLNKQLSVWIKQHCLSLLLACHRLASCGKCQCRFLFRSKFNFGETVDFVASKRRR